MATPDIISPDYLEAQRRAGQKDDYVADQMAQASPVFASQLTKIRKKYGGDPAATTAFLNTRFYGTVDHSPEKPQGIIGRSLDRIWENGKKDIGDIRTALRQYKTGEQGYVDTALQSAGNIASILASPVSQPLQEVVGTVAKGIYENVPGVKPAVQEIGQSKLVQEGVLPALRKTTQFLTEESARNPALRSLAAVGEGALDLADVLAAGQIAKQGANLGISGAKATIAGAKMIPQIPESVGRGLGVTARIATQPIRSGFSGFMQGARGQADDLARAAVTESKTELAGAAAEAVRKGMDEKVMRFAIEQTTETKRAMASMAKAARVGAEKLGGDTAHKEILGKYMLNNIEHVMTEKQVVGKALGAMKKGMAMEALDMTDDLIDLRKRLRDAGAIFNKEGKIVSLAAEADDNIPLLQTALDFLKPDRAGRVLKSFGDVDMWRSKMFKEMNSIKAKLQPSTAGQSTLGFSENVINSLRRSAIKNAAKSNPRLLAYNDAYEELSTQASKFLKSIGYKGKLGIDDITAKDLRAGEVALRSLGNASAEVRDSFESLIKTARKYGYESGVDEMGLIRWTDALEDIFPITPSRSLQGGVSRGTRDALGNFTEDVVRGGVRRGVFEAGSAKILEAIDKWRGITPEERFRLLMQVLEAPPDTHLLQVIDDATDAKIPQYIRDLTKDISTGEMEPVAKSAVAKLTPEAVQSTISSHADDALSAAQKLSKEGAIPEPTVAPQPTSAGAITKQGTPVSVLQESSAVDGAAKGLDTQGAGAAQKAGAEVRGAGGKGVPVTKELKSSYIPELKSRILPVKRVGHKYQAGDFIGDKRSAEFYAKMKAFEGAIVRSYGGGNDTILSVNPFPKVGESMFTVLRDGEIIKHSTMFSQKNVVGFVDSAPSSIPPLSKELRKQFPNLTEEEIKNPTPEEKSLGMVGGSDSVGGGVNNLEPFIGEDGKITLYHGSSKSLKRGNLDYGTFLTNSKTEALDYANMRGRGKGVVSSFKFDPSEVRLNDSTGEFQYIGKSKSLAGKKYPEQIYRAYNDVNGSNLTAKEIDAMDLQQVRGNASMGLEGGSSEFDSLVKSPSTPSPLPSPAIPKELEPLAKEAAPVRKFIGEYKEGEILTSGEKVLGNFGKKKDAIAIAEKTGARVTPYIGGEKSVHQNGWLVSLPENPYPLNIPYELRPFIEKARSSKDYGEFVQGWTKNSVKAFERALDKSGIKSNRDFYSLANDQAHQSTKSPASR